MRTGVRVPRMNTVMERWIGTIRNELLDRKLVWSQAHPLYALREFEAHSTGHRPHRSLVQGAPLRLKPEPITDLDQIIDLGVRRRDWLGGTLHEYEHEARPERTDS